MRPLHDPLRSLVYSAGDRAVRDVYVEGEQVVRDGAVLRIDVEVALETLSRAQAATLATTSERDWAGRSVDEMSPRVFRISERVAQQRPGASPEARR